MDKPRRCSVSEPHRVVEDGVKIKNEVLYASENLGVPLKHSEIIEQKPFSSIQSADSTLMKVVKREDGPLSPNEHDVKENLPTNVIFNLVPKIKKGEKEEFVGDDLLNTLHTCIEIKNEIPSQSLDSERVEKGNNLHPLMRSSSTQPHGAVPSFEDGDATTSRMTIQPADTHEQEHFPYWHQTETRNLHVNPREVGGANTSRMTFQPAGSYEQEHFPYWHQTETRTLHVNPREVGGANTSRMTFQPASSYEQEHFPHWHQTETRNLHVNPREVGGANTSRMTIQPASNYEEEFFSNPHQMKTRDIHANPEVAFPYNVPRLDKAQTFNVPASCSISRTGIQDTFPFRGHVQPQLFALTRLLHGLNNQPQPQLIRHPFPGSQGFVYQNGRNNQIEIPLTPSNTYHFEPRQIPFNMNINQENLASVRNDANYFRHARQIHFPAGQRQNHEFHVDLRSSDRACECYQCRSMNQRNGSLPLGFAPRQMPLYNDHREKNIPTQVFAVNSENNSSCAQSSVTPEDQSCSNSGGRPFSCTFCADSFVTQTELKIHMRRNSGKVYGCHYLCAHSFSNPCKLQKHMRVHTGGKPFRCQQCPASFQGEWNLKSHMLARHSDENPFRCPQCSSSFTCKSSLTFHLKKHSGERPFPCDQCDASFQAKNCLMRHKTVHSRERPFVCEQCGSAFARKNGLTKHLVVHTNERPYRCEHCDKSFKARVTLRKHMRAHNGEKSFICAHCSAAFPVKGELYRHMMIHTGVKPYKCKYCPFACNQGNSLKRHLRTHTGEKPFTCDHCSVSFTQKGSLISHLKQHSDGNPYRCDHCSVSFRRKSRLAQHMKIHSCETPFSCEQCPFATNQKSSFTKHMKLHLGDQVFTCDHCSAAFARKRRLISHLKRHDRVNRLVMEETAPAIPVQGQRNKIN
ncbi:unnamed protein product [Bemisia tabaci]|uniref:C2H2-type domain-containing protein n=1 Tax=Bemisia tabaci TaxID=7038 RepID=A0A9P0A419_BEMTA|nr:unnamed protein product [Bemisia tabaci]